jgi:hypothetical protein
LLRSVTAPRFYAERSSEEPAVIPFLTSEDVEAFKILTCGAVGMVNDPGGICDFVLRALLKLLP